MARMIDADALQEEFKKSHNGKRLMLIDTAPTIVPEVLNKLNKLDQQELYLSCHFKELVLDEVSNTPQKTGRWIFEKGDGETCVDGYMCSACGRSFHTKVPYFSEYNFCPNCGAKMEGEAK